MPALPASSWERFDAQSLMARARRHLDYASPLILVLVASWQWLGTDHRDLWHFAGRSALLVAAWWFGILWHELGHVALARAAGLDPYVILLGSGRSIVRATFCGITVDCGWFPGSGLTLFGPERGDRLRGRTIVAVAGGPVATLLLLGAAVWFLCRACGFGEAAPIEHLRAVLAGECAGASVHLGPAASALFVSNFLVLLTTARPRVGHSGPLSLPSDLSMIARLLLHRSAGPVAIEGWSRQRGFARCLALREYDEAEQLALALLRAEPNRSQLRLDFAKMLFLAGRYVDAAREFRCLLEVGSEEHAAELATWLLESTHWIAPTPTLETELHALQTLAATWLGEQRLGRQ